MVTALSLIRQHLWVDKSERREVAGRLILRNTFIELEAGGAKNVDYEILGDYL